MLDENLPVFFLKPSTTGISHYRTLNLSHRGSDPEPAYTLQYLDPNSTSQTHKNCYAAALFDPHNPEVLYGEVLVRPSWTQPTLSQEEVRRHGGIPPPPEPRVPVDFNVQLYNPDQQVTIHMREGKWGSSDTFEFSIPERTFRAPSASTLDRSQSDPGSLDITPRIKFVWKRESKLSKDLTCFMTGRSTDTEKKRSKRDPDIAVALWRSLREMTLYESNLSRMDTEDPKGLEVTLLMSAIVIKDLYFSSRERIYELFNVQEIGAARGRTSSQGKAPVNGPTATAIAQQPPNQPRHEDIPLIHTPASSEQSSKPPPPDPREQWQIEAETARLRYIAEAEAREAQKHKKERQKAEEAERKRLQKIFEQEQKDARRRAEEIDKETQRLRRIYGVEGQSLRPEPNIQQRDQHSRRSFQGTLQSVPQGRASTSSSRPQLGSNGLVYDTPQPVMSGGNPGLLSIPQQARKKKSIFSLRSISDELASSASQGRLSKKQSTMW